MIVWAIKCDESNVISTITNIAERFCKYGFITEKFLYTTNIVLFNLNFPGANKFYTFVLKRIGYVRKNKISNPIIINTLHLDEPPRPLSPYPTKKILPMCWLG